MRNYDYERAREFWQACVLASLASGRFQLAEVVARADSALAEYGKRYPPEEEHGNPNLKAGD